MTNPHNQLHHIFDEADCYALWAAYAAGRPLLVRGKPGTGKSQMAKAIAEQLGWTFVSEVIRGSTELSDLHWHFDAIGRLSEAQAMSFRPKETADDWENRINPLRFLSPGAFWWAYDWVSAEQQYQACVTQLRPRPDWAQDPSGQAQSQPQGIVLLLDEIDKAEPDLPNGLLETLGQYQFTVPYLNQRQVQASIKNPIEADPARLLVVITTNEERELPTAFVRRCLVHTLKMEESAETVGGIEKRVQWLMQRGQLHFGQHISEQVYRQAAELLWQDRMSASYTRYPPGLAEYIDLLKALHRLKHDEQESRLTKIASYTLKKEVVE
ncbi:MAG: AAA family ATPase [Nitrosomonas sp.]